MRWWPAVRNQQKNKLIGQQQLGGDIESQQTQQAQKEVLEL